MERLPLGLANPAGAVTPNEDALSPSPVHAWSDNTFKQKLLNYPAEAVAEHGIEVRKGLNVRVIEDTADSRHLVLPVAPENSRALTNEKLERRAEAEQSLIVDLMVESGIAG